MAEISHGGRLDDAVALHGGTSDKWMDLSTGINPIPYPLPDIPSSAWQRLPDSAAWEAAAAACRNSIGVTNDVGVSLANGTQMHIQNIPYLFKPQAVAIVGFTYQEHGLCWSRAGHEVYVTDGLESAEATARIVVVVNPNNPDGRTFDPEALTGLARRLGAKGGLLVVDESFGDVAPNASVAQEAGRDGLIVLRSLGKFYGLAGVRFGAALGARSIISRLEDRLGPWAVSGPALAVATAALADENWKKKNRKKLANLREGLEELLLEHGFEVVGGTDLFVLVRHGRSEDVYRHLNASHILTRSFPGKPEWLRFGLPANKPQLNRLDKALKKFYDLG